MAPTNYVLQSTCSLHLCGYGFVFDGLTRRRLQASTGDLRRTVQLSRIYPAPADRSRAVAVVDLRRRQLRVGHNGRKMEAGEED